jgi:hypothetical protein
VAWSGAFCTQQASAQEPSATELIAKARAELLASGEGRLTAPQHARLARAIEFADQAHRGQLRDGGRPAVLHVLRVATTILRASPRGQPVDMTSVVTAVLHDTIEDTKVTAKDVRKVFGERTARSVQWVTLDELSSFKNDKTARDKAYYERFRGAPRSAQVVKYYDRLDNIADMSGWSIEGKLGYLQATRQKVIWSLRQRSPDLARGLEIEVDKLVRHYSQLLARQADRLKRYRRADGTLRWKPLVRDRALREGAGLAHFTLALFLKELAIVLKTGDRLRIEEFFDGLATTDFFVHYGLFAAGARVGEVAYARYLGRYVRPRFVSGLLRTNVALAAGLALPQLVKGTFSGEAFAVSLGALGLSSAAVKAGLSGIRWVASLPTSGAATRALRLVRVGKVGGWLFTVAETAVVLYVAEELEGRYRAWKDAREARQALGQAGLDLYASLGRAGLDGPSLDKALDTYAQAWSDYRDFLYRPVLAEEARLQERLSRLGRRAKLGADERAVALAKLSKTPALKARLIQRYGSLEGWLDARAANEDAEIRRDAEAALSAYRKAVEAGLNRVYREGQRATPLLRGLSSSDATWLRAGLGENATGDPYHARRDPFATWGRRRARQRLVEVLGDASGNRLQTYADERVLLEAATSHLAPDLAARVQARLAVVDRLAALDTKLSGTQRGLSDSLRGQ